jgi:hypothetical protein
MKTAGPSTAIHLTQTPHHRPRRGRPTSPSRPGPDHDGPAGDQARPRVYILPGAEPGSAAPKIPHRMNGQARLAITKDENVAFVGD